MNIASCLSGLCTLCIFLYIALHFLVLISGVSFRPRHEVSQYLRLRDLIGLFTNTNPLFAGSHQARTLLGKLHRPFNNHGTRSAKYTSDQLSLSLVSSVSYRILLGCNKEWVAIPVPDQIQVTRRRYWSGCFGARPWPARPLDEELLRLSRRELREQHVQVLPAVRQKLV